MAMCLLYNTMSSIEIEMNSQQKARRSQTTAVGKMTLNLTETQLNGKFADVPLSYCPAGPEQ